MEASWRGAAKGALWEEAVGETVGAEEAAGVTWGEAAAPATAADAPVLSGDRPRGRGGDRSDDGVVPRCGRGVGGPEVTGCGSRVDDGRGGDGCRGVG